MKGRSCKMELVLVDKMGGVDRMGVGCMQVVGDKWVPWWWL